jgi:hypothetical protein
MGRAVTAQEIAMELGWKEAVTYKWLPAAANNKRLVRYEDGPPRESNVKLVVPVEQRSRFLPYPSVLFKENPKLKDVEFINPFTGDAMCWP